MVNNMNGFEVVEAVESKFEGGVLRADGVTKRYEAHGHEILQPEQVSSRVEEAKEARQLNVWHSMIHKFGKKNCDSMFKTREVRRAELEAILERRLR